MATYRHWDHFLALESDFAATARFVEFSRANFKTFSAEYTKLLLAIGSEIDVVLKITCKKIDKSAPRYKIDHYRACMMAHTQIASEEVFIRRYNLSFKPWSEWATGKNPTWWGSYNGVKHHRYARFNEANLENCADAISGLFVAVIYSNKAEGNKPDLLRPRPILLGRHREPGYFMHEGDYSAPDFT